MASASASRIASSRWGIAERGATGSVPVALVASVASAGLRAALVSLGTRGVWQDPDRMSARGAGRRGASAAREDGVAHHGVDLGLPAPAVEDAVVADAGLQVVAAVHRPDRGAELVRRVGLTGAADVV